MLIKHFAERHFRSRDPLRPGQWIVDKRMVPSLTSAIVHEGEQYDAAATGWFDVPEPVGNFFLSRPGWRTPAQVDEEVAAGVIEENDSPVSAPAPRKRTTKPAA